VNSYLSHIGRFSVTDHLVALLVLAVLLVLGRQKHQRIYANGPEQGPRLYFAGFAYKVVFSYLFALVYFFYYGGGDTIAYFSNGLIMQRLFIDNPAGFFRLFLAPSISWEDYFTYFNNYTGYPEMSLSAKANNHMVVKVSTLLNIAGLNNFFATSMVFGAIAYQFVWKFYRSFCSIVPGREKILGFVFLFFPSFVFWSSGIMKDTICVAAIAELVYVFYHGFIRRERKLRYLFSALVCMYLLFVIKPYLLLALVPGFLFWGPFTWLRSLKSPLLRFLFFPFIILISGAGIYLFFRQGLESSSLGSTDEALRYASVVQQDLIRADQYGENFIDIGAFDPTFSGVLSKVPIAVSVGLFMPFLWQARNPVMFMSGLENTFLLLMTLYFLFRTRIYGIFVYTFANPVLLFCITFSLATAFIVGLTTANFGALVRYKIPLLPFFISYFVILIDTMQRKKEEEEGDDNLVADPLQRFKNAEKRIVARNTF